VANLYKSAFEKIDVPKGTLEKTSLAMKQAQQSGKKPSGWPRYFGYGGLAAACIAAIFLLPTLWNTAPGIFVTNLGEGRHVEQVELVDGLLVFQQEPNALVVMPPNLGPMTRLEEWESEAYKAYLGVDVTPPYLPQDMALTEESAVVYLDKDGKIIRDNYTMRFSSGGGGRLDISVSKDKLPLQSDLGRQENSVIGNSPLSVGFEPDLGVYWAQFVRGGVGFHIESEHVSQEEFIKAVYGFFR
jgi:hypothetical protein